ncbi:MAG: hypothetical protein [Bacteriophage sp.]|nr:MAG: hypothetical protein [Bacteriophage sp.]
MADWWYWAAQGTSDVLDYLGDTVEYKTQRGLLQAQAKAYERDAKSALWEGRQNADKVFRQGEAAQGTLTQDYGASGVDVNTSQTVSNAQRTLQKSISDDVFATMYRSAKEAEQLSINAKMAKYQAKQAKSGFGLGSIGTWTKNATNLVSSILGSGK